MSTVVAILWGFWSVVTMIQINQLRRANAVWTERFEAVEDSMYHIEDHVCGEDVDFSDSDAGNTAPAVH